MKKKLLLLCLVVLTILWLAASFSHVAAYNQMREEDRERLGDLIDLMDYSPVWLHGWGKLLLVTGLLIAIGWIFIIFEIVKKAKKRTKGRSKLILLCMLLFLIISGVTITHIGFLPVEAESDWEAPFFCWFNAVDVLFVCDEELAEHEEIVDIKFPFQQIWKPSTWKIENILFPLLQERFLNDAGISINFNGWLDWDSNDNEQEMDFLLIEAMNKTGWIPQSIYREASHTLTDAYGRPVTFSSNRRMDILFVLTYQSSPRIGFAMTEEAAEFYSSLLGKTVYWDACILKYREGDRRLSIQYMQHELSHLFGLEHCPNQCCMHPDLVSTIYVSWCSTCRNEMRAWADIIPSEQYPPR